MADQGLGLSSYSSEEKNARGLGARVAHLTDVGLRRRNNQDNHLILPLPTNGTAAEGGHGLVAMDKSRLLVAVADGMGGHFGGEVASRMCVEGLATAIANEIKNPSNGQLDIPGALQKAVTTAHQVVFAHAQSYDEAQVMGTTLTAVLLHGTRAELAQVGDSRAYLFRDGNLILLTQDQTIGSQLRSRGEDPNNVDARIQEMLVQAVGAQEEIDVIMTGVDLEPRDFLLLCCDGLHKVVSPEDIVETLEGPVGLEEKVTHLVALANEGGGPDNITVILTEICQVESTN